MNKIEELLWNLSPMGAVEKMFGGALNIVDSLSKGELPDAKDVLHIAGHVGHGEGDLLDAADVCDSSPDADACSDKE
ncbi:MAG: hypothetical protein HY255_12195 [Betaproteobacteria bacterium]|nr:hypothetical protein [Betaproteobacteria bacterium]